MRDIRCRYVTGEFRFRHGYSKHNPRKMVRMWAEKEMRNLIRLETAGIPGNIRTLYSDIIVKTLYFDTILRQNYSGQY